MTAFRIRFGQRELAPSWLMTLLTLALLPLFIGLGRWQWHRGDARQTLWDAFDAGAIPAQPLGARSTADLQRFSRIAVSGRWDGERQFLLDNRTHDGKAGYEVLTPLRLDDGRWLLVNRGWVPFSGFRDRLPDVALPTPAQPSVDITGRLDELPSAGLSGGRAAPAAGGTWPRVTAFPRTAELEAALGGQKLEPQLLLLDPQSGSGYVRAWRPPGMEPMRHWSYAVQWWSFAVLLLILYVILNLKKRASP